MFIKILLATWLVVVTVAIHAVGLSLLLRTMMKTHTLTVSGFRPVTMMVIGLTCWLLVTHLVEISVWGLFYFWQGCLPDAESAFYFSAVTYTTVGYGDLVLPKPWRMLAPLEALTGILMCGLSTGLFFALVNRWISKWLQGRLCIWINASQIARLFEIAFRTRQCQILQLVAATMLDLNDVLHLEPNQR